MSTVSPDLRRVQFARRAISARRRHPFCHVTRALSPSVPNRLVRSARWATHVRPRPLPLTSISADQVGPTTIIKECYWMQCSFWNESIWTYFGSYFETVHDVSASHLKVLFSFAGTAQEAGAGRRLGAAGTKIFG